MEAFDILSYKARKKQKRRFLGTSSCVRGIYILEAHSESTLEFILRGQPTF